MFEQVSASAFFHGTVTDLCTVPTRSREVLFLIKEVIQEQLNEYDVVLK